MNPLSLNADTILSAVRFLSDCADASRNWVKSMTGMWNDWAAAVASRRLGILVDTKNREDLTENIAVGA
jgi:hypothetical protein